MNMQLTILLDSIVVDSIGLLLVNSWIEQVLQKLLKNYLKGGLRVSWEVDESIYVG